MNKTYRVVFNHQRNAFVVVSELAHTQGKSKSSTQSVVSTASIATAVVCGVTAVATPAVADTWNVTSSNTY
ncbi:MAG: ESPR domain-containing protein, partial [Neisseriaceae bacterium]|nr:ESPR domain-containing protein [Neisseriaceae bacterium]